MLCGGYWMVGDGGSGWLWVVKEGAGLRFFFGSSVR